MVKMAVALRILAWLFIAAGGITLLAAAISIYAFEYPFLAELLGWQGISLLVAWGLCILYLLWSMCGRHNGKAASTSEHTYGKALALLILLATSTWVLEWIGMDRPITSRIRMGLVDNTDLDLFARDLAWLPLLQNDVHRLFPGAPAESRASLALMAARVRINRPVLFLAYPMGETIGRYAKQYGVSPVLLFYWLYLGSYYGEALSGPLPFAANLTGETFRDLVQVHLPAWFVESPLRAHLVEDDVLERLFSPSLGYRLRYALQKATYDVSMEPYDTNIFSDVLLVMQQYGTEFQSQEWWHPGDPLYDAFQNLDQVAGFRACPEDYYRGAYEPDWYNRNRDVLIRYARAVFYRTLTDFDFSTRVQALVARYYSDAYVDELGKERWEALSEPQRLALIAMLRDVYTPNIGTLSDNVYALPEFNCAPFRYVSTELSKMPGLPDSPAIWRPEHPEFLWAGASYKLRVLAEVWKRATGKEFGDMRPERTLRDNLPVLYRLAHRLEVGE